MSVSETNDEGLHVLALSAKNFMGLRVLNVEIGPEGLLFAGENGSGKSSALKILSAAFCGAAGEPAVPIREGSFTAEIKVVLGRDGVTKYHVSKTWENGKAAKLTVTAEGGHPVSSPQKLLDGFVEAISFDVGEFINPAGAKTPEARAKVQQEILLRACPVEVNLVELATKRLKAFNDRRDVKRDADRLAAELRTMQQRDVPEEVHLAALSEELAAGRAKVEAGRAARQRLETLDDRAGRLVARIKELTQQLADAQQEALDVEKLRGEALEVPPGPDLAPIEKKIADGYAQNTSRTSALLANADFKRKMGELGDTRGKVEAFAAEIEACDKVRLDALAKASFPWPGLSIEEGVGVVLRDAGGALPFDQLNTALKVQIAFRVLAKLSPQARFSVIEDGNCLDHKSLAVLAREARVAGYPLIIERINCDDALPCVELVDGAAAPGGGA